MKKMNENTKVTLTFGQLKKLVRESSESNEDALGRMVNATMDFFLRCADDVNTAVSVNKGNFDSDENRMTGVFVRIARTIVNAGRGGPQIARLARSAETFDESAIKEFFNYCMNDIVESLESAFSVDLKARDVHGVTNSDYAFWTWEILKKVRNILARAKVDVRDLDPCIEDFRMA